MSLKRQQEKEAGPPHSHRERTEDPSRAKPKGGPKDQKGPKGPREGKAEKTNRGNRAAGQAERGGGTKKDPKDQGSQDRERTARTKGPQRRGGGGSALLPMEQKTEHHFGHQSGRDTSKQSPNTNKTPTQTGQTEKTKLQLVTSNRGPHPAIVLVLVLCEQSRFR